MLSAETITCPMQAGFLCPLLLTSPPDGKVKVNRSPPSRLRQAQSGPVPRLTCPLSVRTAHWTSRLSSCFHLSLPSNGRLGGDPDEELTMGNELRVSLSHRLCDTALGHRSACCASLVLPCGSECSSYAQGGRYAMPDRDIGARSSDWTSATVVPPSACRRAPSICSSVRPPRRPIVRSSFYVKMTTAWLRSSDCRWPYFRPLLHWKRLKIS